MSCGFLTVPPLQFFSDPQRKLGCAVAPHPLRELHCISGGSYGSLCRSDHVTCAQVMARSGMRPGPGGALYYAANMYALRSGRPWALPRNAPPCRLA